jgi:hypothetical protein
MLTSGSAVLINEICDLHLHLKTYCIMTHLKKIIFSILSICLCQSALAQPMGKVIEGLP